MKSKREITSRRETTLAARKAFVRTKEVSLAGAYAGAIMAQGQKGLRAVGIQHD